MRGLIQRDYPFSDKEEAHRFFTKLTGLLKNLNYAPWYIIPANHKWFRNLAISQIIADTMGEMGLKLPPTHVDMADIRRKFHTAESEAKDGEKRRTKGAKKAK